MRIKEVEMAVRCSIAEARRSLPRLIREAESGKTIRLTRRGVPVAVLVGHRTFERMVAGRRSFVDAYADFTRTVDLFELAFDPAEPSEGVRDVGPGREVRL